jgi:uroporphyrinogen-III synthase
MSNAGLGGRGVLVTRPVNQSQELAAAIEAAGGEAIAFPAIDIVGRDLHDIEEELAQLPKPDIVVFVSRNAVAYGLAAFEECGAMIAAVGPVTRKAIETAGTAVDVSPDAGFDSEHLLEHVELKDVGGKNVIIVRGQSGRELLAETLGERGANVDYLCVYERRPHKPLPAELRDLESATDAGKIRFVTVMSVDSLQCLLEIMPPKTLNLLRQVTLVAPSTRVLQTASELIPGIETALARGPQAPEMVDTLIRLAQSEQDS